MSIRNIRKLYGSNTLPPPEGNSDEEYEPLYAKNSPSKYKYQGLVLSSHSESEHESTENTQPAIVTKKKKKKKKKQGKPKPQTSYESKENLDLLDEIDRSVLEVNALLGSPPPPPQAEEKPPVDPAAELLTLQQKHLNVAYELNRLFGPETDEGGTRRRGRQPDLNRLLRKTIIVPVTENILNFKKVGLSMSVQRRENGLTFFTFDHSREYQRVHRAFLHLANYRTGDIAVSVEEAQRNMHVEGMLECADSMFRYEAYSSANTLIEQTIAYMQYVAHPFFKLTDRKVRLEYKFAENRPFHIAVLKYLHLLTNRACHRTALELAKLLLNLDPTDPLAIIFIIDTLALRARQHQWLIDAVEYWTKERDAGFLFNIQYSCSMAHFHVAIKKKSDVSYADSLLKEAIMNFPLVVPKILECAGVTQNAKVQNCKLFKKADDITGKNFKDLIYLYAKFTWSKWREPDVFEWFTRNINELADQYEADPQIRERADVAAFRRMSLFQGWPEEVLRHLSVIKPMSALLVDGAVPRVSRTRSSDPVPPPDGISRYRYDLVDAPTTATAGISSLYDLFSSIMPLYDLPTPQELERVMEGRRDGALAEALPEGQNYDEAAGFDAVLGYDTPTDEDNEEDNAARGTFVRSVGALTDAVRRFMDVYESGNDPGIIHTESPDSPEPESPDTPDSPEPESPETPEPEVNRQNENNQN